MVAGMPGSQKSGFTLWLTSRWAEVGGLSCLYFSADMAQHTAITRLAGLLTGHTSETVSRGLSAGAEDFYAEALARVPLTFCFDSAPGLDDVMLELYAYVELYDEYPDVIVVDNLINIQVDHENEWSGLRVALIELHSLARLTGSAVVVLHHMSEAGQRDTTVPAARRDLHGKVSQLPELILSLAFDPSLNKLNLAAVKNRNGPADASGRTVVSLAVDPERTQFRPWAGYPIHTGHYYQED